jgi:hypothetical protein
MRNSMTAVLERDGITGQGFTTEPYEVAWAGEARWFVRVLNIPAEVARVDFVVQISPDGLHWCDNDGDTHSATEAGVVSWVTREFGGWLRLRASIARGDSPQDATAPDATVPALVYLALKA